METKVEKKIKLFTKWKLKDRFENRDKVDDYVISHGIWEIVGFENMDTNNPVATLRCIMPCHKNLKQLDERKVPFVLLRELCEEVMIITVDDNLKDVIRYKKLQRITDDK